MHTTNNNERPEIAPTSERVTGTEARQGRPIKGMWMVLAGGAALAAILVAVIALPYGA